MIRTRYFVVWVVVAVIVVILTALLSGCGRERDPFGPPTPVPCASTK